MYLGYGKVILGVTEHWHRQGVWGFVHEFVNSNKNLLCLVKWNQLSLQSFDSALC